MRGGGYVKWINDKFNFSDCQLYCESWYSRNERDILETKERHVTSVWKLPSNIIFKFCNLLKTLQINKLGN